MPDELRSLVFLLYEYLYNKGNRLESDYINRFDECYKILFSSRSHSFSDSFQFLELIQAKARFDSYCDIQKELYEILRIYKPDKFV